MEAISAGKVVFVEFPFSDLSGSKLRPAVVLARVERNDWLLCQITSKPYADSGAIEIDERSFATGSLAITSYVRPTKLFTAHIILMDKVVGTINAATHSTLVEAIVKTLQSEIR